MRANVPEVIVSVIVPTYRDWHALRSCLDALRDQTLPTQEVEILVVENAGESQPHDLTLPGNARLLHESAPGSYAARNRGIAEARGAVIAFLDADCLPAVDWLQAGVECLQGQPDTTMVGGNIELTYAAPQLTPAECFEKAFAFRQAQNAADGVAVTANLIVHRQVVEAVGVFDDNLMSGGDFEWTRRATSAGFKLVYCDAAVVRHPARHSLASLVQKARRVSTGSMTLHNEKRLLQGSRRVLANILTDLRELFRRSEMTWRERWWALYVMAYLKFVKLHQRLTMTSRPHETRKLPR
ncbi:glycosyltransferase family 2 protein [Halomonas sp. QHL1]|uniref:glycosyltransferase family 2 protein n=1 Tax=Halomonas sp. QHL1 TaxID=1123773 RepID=UPI0008FCFCAA|nr:glycosyltransferase [Halomonas sp. QHL1]OJA07272.1 hypothetical protein QHL1GM_18700 [Halomonas sp. QHL1]